MRKWLKWNRKERDNLLNTSILEKTENGYISYDIFQKLAGDRLLFISEPIDDRIATDIVACLYHLDSEDDSKKISLYINSEDGDIRSVLMIYDVIKMMKSPIETVCVGSAFGEAAVLLSAGTKGMRLATRSALICMNQILFHEFVHSDMHDAKTLLSQVSSDNDRVMKILSKTTGKTLSKVKKDCTKKMYMDAAQAKAYGIIDKVIGAK